MTTYKKTRKVDRSWRSTSETAPPGLLRIHPAGAAPRLAFHVLRQEQTIIGRTDECDVTLDDDEVSREHAAIHDVGGTWRLEDLDSANGVFVNGQRVDAYPLLGGEVIRVGCALLLFLPEGPAARSGSLPVRHDLMVAGPTMDHALDLLARAAAKNLSVLIFGETGTGKELAAQHLHRSSGRSGPFVPVNCGAITATLFESEMFGHRRGAFTGATRDNPGHFRRAHGGTLFLDEIGEMPLQEQPKLLRVLQDRRVLPVGGSSAVPVDVKVVCATNRELGPMVESGDFRLDLFARVSELVVELPPLAERVEDIPALVDHFMGKHDEARRQVPVEVMEVLCCRDWPRNVRQLENSVRRALLLAGDDGQLTPEHFLEPRPRATGTHPGGAAHDAPAPAPVAADEPAPARQLREALTVHDGDVSLAAEELGISASQLYRRAKKYGLRVAHFRK